MPDRRAERAVVHDLDRDSDLLPSSGRSRSEETGRSEDERGDEGFGEHEGRWGQKTRTARLFILGAVLRLRSKYTGIERS